MAAYDTLLEACRREECLTPELALGILRPDLPAGVWESVREAADRRMRAISGGRGRVYATIGVDAVPCKINCKFCSHGAAWGKAVPSWELSAPEIHRRARTLSAPAPDWLTLRTTQQYGVARLGDLCRQVRGELPAGTELIVNTGEFTTDEANSLADAGVSMSYHTFRLREGTDTGIRPEARKATLAAIRNSRLSLAALVEPVGPEHTDGELVAAAFLLKQYGVSLGGAMARVPVPGTPLAAHGPLPEDRLVRVIAMTRLISGPEVANICVHPPVREAFRAGANTLVVESGAIPRDETPEAGAWRRFGMREAREYLRSCDYSVQPREKP